jgi:hypothetical protein
MEKLAFYVRVRQPCSPIELVTDNRVTDEGQVDPNLMRAPGLD